MSQPTASEISAFLAALADRNPSDQGEYAQLMTRKAELLERIAAACPSDVDAAEVAANARARAEQLTSTDR
ncbi:hypothetical protein [Streptacidiphilus sp. P02-A3a]|uniref:hypothetical protein n=1 Tax=Streptacidiphilus sp. P02-A3a TaxID=2704468 RepID=UPI0015F7BA56|nr:hypothetical protein [Streptacidiphilus sp. P02-A3a]QMU68119.1 hypothetical protein GXP74_07670 [Streptacidiphilus sp. P02-A3a]